VTKIPSLGQTADEVIKNWMAYPFFMRCTSVGFVFELGYFDWQYDKLRKLPKHPMKSRGPRWYEWATTSEEKMLWNALCNGWLQIDLVHVSDREKQSSHSDGWIERELHRATGRKLPSGIL
jgi:hypothetical protein